MTSQKRSVKHTKKGSKRTGVRKNHKSKYKALVPHLNTRARYEEIEDIASYANDLPEEAKEWLNRFTHEYVCANFKHGGELLHTNKEERKICTDKNNARHRDVYTRAKCNNDMMSLDSDMGFSFIDKQRESDNVKSIYDENDMELAQSDYSQIDEDFDETEGTDNTADKPDGSLDET